MSKNKDYSNPQPGDVIPVKVGEKYYDTIIDDSGVQRFRANSVLQYMFDHNTNGEPSMQIGDDGYIKHDAMFNLNTLASAYRAGKFDKIEYMELVMQGYSVSGFLDLHDFADMMVENPLWDEPVVIEKLEF